MAKFNVKLTFSYSQEGFADWQESFTLVDGKLCFADPQEEITEEFLARCAFPRYAQLREIASLLRSLPHNQI